jgi:membrane associated rhomboid family serine protease
MFPLRDINPSRIFPFTVIGLILVNVAVFCFELTLNSATGDVFFHDYGFIPRLANSHYWTYFTSIFLHADLFHLLSNLWFLWIFGDNVEARMGHTRFLVFYMICGILASEVQLLSNPGSMIPTIGASGAIAGVMGAYLLLFKHARILSYLPPFFLFRVPAWIYLVLWLGGQMTSGVALWNEPSGEIAVWAHIGGFIAGMITYRLFTENDPLDGDFVEKRFD